MASYVHTVCQTNNTRPTHKLSLNDKTYSTLSLYISPALSTSTMS